MNDQNPAGRPTAASITKEQLAALYAELDRNARRATSFREAWSRALARERGERAGRVRVEARIAAVRALHHPVEHMALTICDACSTKRSTGPHGAWERHVIAPWPCDTIDALDGLAEQPACAHPITHIVANLPRLDLTCRTCGAILAGHTGDDHLPDQSWLFDCPKSDCRAQRLAPCRRRNGTVAAISHGERWDMYNNALHQAFLDHGPGAPS